MLAPIKSKSDAIAVIFILLIDPEVTTILQSSPVFFLTYNIARLEEIKEGKIKNLVKDNVLICDGSHNSGGAEVLNQYIQSLNCDVHAIIGMMKNKNHQKYISYFKNIKSVTTIDIPNTPNAISGKELKEKFNSISNVQYKENI